MKEVVLWPWTGVWEGEVEAGRVTELSVAVMVIMGV